MALSIDLFDLFDVPEIGVGPVQKYVMQHSFHERGLESFVQDSVVHLKSVSNVSGSEIIIFDMTVCLCNTI